MARFAVGDAAFGQEHEAQELVRRCSECAALAADIAAISKSVAKMPAPPRQRDFRLTTEQAEQLRGSRFDRWLRTITGSGWTTVRPVAAVALSVGMVMSVVGFLPSIGAGISGPTGTDALNGPVAAAGNPTPETPETGRGTTLPAPVATPDKSEISGGPGHVVAVGSPASNTLDQAYLSEASSAPEAGGQFDGLATRDLRGAGASVRDLILLSGLALTVIAILVLALLYAARRRYYDPLLR
ncbi:MAG TPA: hypothetical protein VM284_05775 [Candidatus Limnocylindria bacterium]|nr:hypothetical protein [Candidatus Limnocylindria bacterium]